MELDEKYWSNRYQTSETGWDLGNVSPPLKFLIDQLSDTSLKILIPGAGNAYEAEYLFSKGFKNVFVLDISSVPLKNLKNRFPTFPTQNLIHKDFFQLEDKFDIVLEQTFFCAISPDLRDKYVSQMSKLLNSNGHLLGVLFGVEFEKKGPPFGGNEKDYYRLFTPFFKKVEIRPCDLSVKPRLGNELIFKCTK